MIGTRGFLSRTDATSSKTSNPLSSSFLPSWASYMLKFIHLQGLSECASSLWKSAASLDGISIIVSHVFFPHGFSCFQEYNIISVLSLALSVRHSSVHVQLSQFIIFRPSSSMVYVQPSCVCEVDALPWLRVQLCHCPFYAIFIAMSCPGNTSATCFSLPTN